MYCGLCVSCLVYICCLLSVVCGLGFSYCCCMLWFVGCLRLCLYNLLFVECCIGGACCVLSVGDLFVACCFLCCEYVCSCVLLFVVCRFVFEP